MNGQYDRATEDIGNIVALEHVNIRVPDQRLATLFYISGLGLTRDPYLMTGVTNMWVNVGRGQFHLPTGEAQVLRGLSQPLAALSFEYRPAAPGESIACLDRLAELDDYAFNISIGETMRLIFDDWRDGKTMTAWIEALANDAASGDIYARLR